MFSGSAYQKEKQTELELHSKAHVMFNGNNI